nr:immunoglobulin light chain junction region [Macaca mulatta]MOW07869.1 immunoglobulin light chain junction region [Macaca mulatta]MOW08483.1 immunoglobulin light chain junction region [Macaca mulatta]MOW08732.1 immunoglobulin light chain junction region [Macaca mulatta]MOW08922.1 immunoglobulin light chain junction region [Macaca mulatta]
CQQHDSYPWTF